MLVPGMILKREHLIPDQLAVAAHRVEAQLPDLFAFQVQGFRDREISGIELTGFFLISVEQGLCFIPDGRDGL